MLIALCRAPVLIDDEIDSATAGTACDIWSLAATLLNCLTGTAPYHGMRSTEMRRALLLRHAPGPVPEDLPAGLQRMLRQCFHADPTQRPSLAEVKQVLLLLLLPDQSLLGHKCCIVVLHQAQFAPSIHCHHHVTITDNSRHVSLWQVVSFLTALCADRFVWMQHTTMHAGLLP